MKHLSRISFVCFLIILIGEILIAFRFLTASQVMDYHQIAMGSDWNHLSMGVQTMTLNFLRSAGLGFLLAGISILFILFFPFRRGERWSRWALVSICLTQSTIMIVVVSSVRSLTPATPPMAPFIILGVLSLIGFITHQSNQSA